MNIIIVVSLTILVLSLAILAVIAFRHVSQLRVLNVDTDAQAKSRKKKDEIILKRLSTGSNVVSKLGRATVKSIFDLRRVGRRAVHRLRSLEEHYNSLKRKGSEGESLTSDRLVKTLDEASQLVHEEKYAQAENKYIEIISLSPRTVKAYEHLGRLYTKTKQFDQAEQSLRFAAKLSPDDASVRTSLGELYMTQEQWTLALEELRRAIEKRAGNAKYLDRYIEAALRAKRGDLAEDGIKKLKEANPENQKIVEFEERLAELSR